jgi:nucleoid-associated protein YgaU
LHPKKFRKRYIDPVDGGRLLFSFRHVHAARSFRKWSGNSEAGRTDVVQVTQINLARLEAAFLAAKAAAEAEAKAAEEAAAKAKADAEAREAAEARKAAEKKAHAEKVHAQQQREKARASGSGTPAARSSEGGKTVPSIRLPALGKKERFRVVTEGGVSTLFLPNATINISVRRNSVSVFC